MLIGRSYFFKKMKFLLKTELTNKDLMYGCSINYSRVYEYYSISITRFIIKQNTIPGLFKCKIIMFYFVFKSMYKIGMTVAKTFFFFLPECSITPNNYTANYLYYIHNILMTNILVYIAKKFDLATPVHVKHDYK